MSTFSDYIASFEAAQSLTALGHPTGFQDASRANAPASQLTGEGHGGHDGPLFDATRRTTDMNVDGSDFTDTNTESFSMSSLMGT